VSLLLTAIRLAFGAILRNKTRATLTVLGIFIGVGAVVIVTALAGGASAKVGGQIDSFAANALFIVPEPTQTSGARSKSTGRLTEGDVKAIAREAVSISHAAPWLSASGQVVFADRNAFTLLVGTSTEYFVIRKYTIDKGAFWTDGDEAIKSKVCIIGATVKDKLFGGEEAVGRTIRIGRYPFRIVGVLTRRGSSPFGEDQDDRLFMPIGSFRGRVMFTAPGRVDQIMASATDENTTQRAQEQVTAILRQRHRIAPDREPDFHVNSQAELRNAQQSITTVLSLLLLGVAAVSLLVGGIGVMNIMLVSVAERTREIGIRMSIGARGRDILMQFLVEAVVLSMMGGILGILLGVGATLGLGRALDWPMTPTPTSVAVAALTSAAIGVFFGFVPAQSAASLDPIEALRVE
jgi:putative ABC transport system permease protein